MAPDPKRRGAAPVQRVRLFDAIRAWANAEPAFGGAATFPGDVAGDMHPSATDKYSLGRTGRKWKGGSFTTLSIEQLLVELLEVINGGEVRWYEEAANGQNYLALRAPASVPADVVWQLPDADGSAGQALSTDGAGALGWVDAANAVVQFLDDSTFDGLKTTFVDGLRATPDTTFNSVVLIHSGVGVLRPVLGVPTAGEVRITGRDLELGYAPRAGDWIAGIYCVAAASGDTSYVSVPWILTDTAWGTYAPGQCIFALDSAPFAATIPANFSGSHFTIDADGRAPSDGPVQWHFLHNSVEILTVEISTLGVCTVVLAPLTDTPVARGDSFRMVGPTPASADMSGFHWMLVLLRS